jgi:hypothetical protein
MTGITDRGDRVAPPVPVNGAAIRSVGRNEMHGAILAGTIL